MPIPWYRQLFAIFLSFGVMLITVWAIDQGSGSIMIATVVGMSFITLMLVFGVEMEEISIEYGSFALTIPFSTTTTTDNDDGDADADAATTGTDTDADADTSSE